MDYHPRVFFSGPVVAFLMLAIGLVLMGPQLQVDFFRIGTSLGMRTVFVQLCLFLLFSCMSRVLRRG